MPLIFACSRILYEDILFAKCRDREMTPQAQPQVGETTKGTSTFAQQTHHDRTVKTQTSCNAFADRVA